MIFKQYSQKGEMFDSNQLCDESWTLFIQAMTLCHSVQYVDGHFAASSPDEEAIIKICDTSGFKFLGENMGSLRC